MRIVYINQSYPPMISGAAIVVERLANDMAFRGHSVLVIAASDRGESYISEKNNVKVVRLASIPNPKRANQRFSPDSFSRISREIRAFNPDIIHIHDVLSLGIAGLWIGRKKKIPVVATIHQLPWFVCAYLPPLPGLKPFVEKRLWLYSRWLNHQCEGMIVPTKTISKTIEEEAGFKTSVISNGVDLNRFSHRLDHSREADHLYNHLRLDPQKPIILHVGRLDVDKRVEVVVRAAAEALKQVNAQLLVVGDGECRKELIHLANFLGIEDQSRFPGFIDPKTEIPAIYRIASVFTTASEIETQGLVLLEAMASELPVVATDSTCIPEIIKNDINGYLVPPGDECAISNRLVEILSNPVKARQMGKSGRLIAQGHSIEESMDRHEELYRSTLKAYQAAEKQKIAISKKPADRKIREVYRSILDQLGRSQ
jgi:1,2-diacylglycerol 3-alpha-glucosyltransferase